MDNPKTPQTPRPRVKDSHRPHWPHPLAEVSIWLDTYDDVFSDFDPRPYNDRTLSDDFIRAVQKEVRETREGRLEVKLMIPVKLRHQEYEKIIADRVTEHFKTTTAELSEEIRKSQRIGLILSLASVVTIFLATSVHQLKAPEYIRNLLTALLEPSGWYMVFTGMDRLFLTPGQKKEQLTFLSKMSECVIEFVEY